MRSVSPLLAVALVLLVGLAPRTTDANSLTPRSNVTVLGGPIGLGEEFDAEISIYANTSFNETTEYFVSFSNESSPDYAVSFASASLLSIIDCTYSASAGSSDVEIKYATLFWDLLPLCMPFQSNTVRFIHQNLRFDYFSPGTYFATVWAEEPSEWLETGDTLAYQVVKSELTSFSATLSNTEVGGITSLSLSFQNLARWYGKYMTIRLPEIDGKYNMTSSQTNNGCMNSNHGCCYKHEVGNDWTHDRLINLRCQPPTTVNMDSTTTITIPFMTNFAVGGTFPGFVVELEDDDRVVAQYKSFSLTLTPASSTAVSFSLDNPVAGEASNLTLTLDTKLEWPTSGSFFIEFTNNGAARWRKYNSIPAGAAVGFGAHPVSNFGAGATMSVHSFNENPNTMWVNYTAPSAISAGTTVSFTIGAFLVPEMSGMTGNVTMTSYAGEYFLERAADAVNITRNTLIVNGFSVNNPKAGSSVDIEVSFSQSTRLYVDSQIKVYFGSLVGEVVEQDGTLSVSGASLDRLDLTDGVLTLKRPTTELQDELVVFTISGVKLPAVTGTMTGGYIQTRSPDSGDGGQDYLIATSVYNAAQISIEPNDLNGVAFSVSSNLAGGSTDLIVDFTTQTGVAQDGAINITLPVPPERESRWEPDPVSAISVVDDNGILTDLGSVSFAAPRFIYVKRASGSGTANGTVSLRISNLRNPSVQSAVTGTGSVVTMTASNTTVDRGAASTPALVANTLSAITVESPTPFTKRSDSNLQINFTSAATIPGGALVRINVRNGEFGGVQYDDPTATEAGLAGALAGTAASVTTGGSYVNVTRSGGDAVSDFDQTGTVTLKNLRLPALVGNSLPISVEIFTAGGDRIASAFSAATFAVTVSPLTLHHVRFTDGAGSVASPVASGTGFISVELRFEVAFDDTGGLELQLPFLANDETTYSFGTGASVSATAGSWGIGQWLAGSSRVLLNRTDASEIPAGTDVNITLENVVIPPLSGSVATLSAANGGPGAGVSVTQYGNTHYLEATGTGSMTGTIVAAAVADLLILPMGTSEFVVGREQSVMVNFTLASDLLGNDKIIVDLPSIDAGSGVVKHWTSSGGSSAVIQQGFVGDGSLSVTVNTDQLEITRTGGGGAVSKGTFVAISVSNIVVPSAETTGLVANITTVNGDASVDTSFGESSGFGIVAGTMQVVSIDAIDTGSSGGAIAGRLTHLDVTVTMFGVFQDGHTMDFNLSGMMARNWTLNYLGTSDVTSISPSITGSVAESANGQILTLTFTLGADIARLTAQSFEITQLRAPAISGTAGISVASFTGAGQAMETGSDTVSINVGTLTGLSLAVTDTVGLSVQDLEVRVTLENRLMISDALKLVFTHSANNSFTLERTGSTSVWCPPAWPASYGCFEAQLASGSNVLRLRRSGGSVDIPAGTSLLVNVTNVLLPGLAGTMNAQAFTEDAVKGNITIDQTGPAAASFPVTVPTLRGLVVTPGVAAPPVAGRLSIDVGFRLATALLPQDALVRVRLQGLGGFPFEADGDTAVTSASVPDGTLVLGGWSTSGDTLSLFVNRSSASSFLPAGSQFNFTISKLIAPDVGNSTIGDVSVATLLVRGGPSHNEDSVPGFPVSDVVMDSATVSLQPDGVQLYANRKATLTLQFTAPADLGDALIELGMPNPLVPFDINFTAASAVVNSGKWRVRDFQQAADPSYSLLYIRRTNDTLIPANSTVTIPISNVQLPAYAGATGDFFLRLKPFNQAGLSIASQSGISGASSVPFPFGSGCNVTVSPLIAGASASVVFALNVTDSIPNDAELEFLLPTVNGENWSFNSLAAASLSPVLMDGALTLTDSGTANRVVFQRTAAFTSVPANSIVLVELTGVFLPEISGELGTFGVNSRWTNGGTGGTGMIINSLSGLAAEESTVLPSDLSSASFVLDSNEAGVLTDITISFVTSNTLTSGSQITLVLPSLEGQDFTADAEGSTTSVSTVSGFVGVGLTLSSFAGNMVNLTTSGGSITQASSLQFKLNNVENPEVTGSLGNVQIRTIFSGTPFVVDRNLTVPVGDIVAGDILNATLTFTSLRAGDDVNVTVRKKLDNPIPADGQIWLQFTPMGGLNWTAPLGLQLAPTANFSLTASESQLNIVSFDNNLLKVQRTGAVQEVPGDGHWIEIFLMDLRLPPVSGSTGGFSIQTRSVADTLIDEATFIPGKTLSQGPLFNESVTFGSTVAGDVTTMTVAFHTRNQLADDGIIRISMPQIEYSRVRLNDSGSTSGIAIDSGFPAGSLSLGAYDWNSGVLDVQLALTGGIVPRHTQLQFTVSDVRQARLNGSLNSFGIETYQADGTSLISQGVAGGVVVDPATMTAASVASDTLVCGQVTTLTFSVDLRNPLTHNGKLVLTTPAPEGSHFRKDGGFFATGTSAVTGVTGLPGGNLVLSWTESPMGVIELTYDNAGGVAIPGDGYTIGFSLTDVRLPSLTGSTGSFDVESFSPLGAPIDSRSFTGLTLTVGNITDWTVEPETLQAGDITTVNISLRLGSELFVGGYVTVSLPNVHGSPWLATAGTAVTSQTGLPAAGGGTFNLVSFTGGVVTVNRTGASVDVDPGTRISFALSYVKLPEIASIATGFSFASFSALDTPIDESVEATPGTPYTVTLEDGDLNQIFVATSGVNAGDIVNVTVRFNVSNQIPSNGIIRVSFPMIEALSFNSTGSSRAVPSNGTFDGSLTLVWDDNTHTAQLARAGLGSIIPAYSLIEFTIVDLRLPGAVGALETFNLSTATGADIAIDSGSYTSSQTLTFNALTLGTVTIEPAVAGASSVVTVNFTTFNRIPAQGHIDVVFQPMEGRNWSALVPSAQALSGFPGAVSVIDAFNATENLMRLQLDNSGLLETNTPVSFRVSGINAPSVTGDSQTVQLFSRLASLRLADRGSAAGSTITANDLSPAYVVAETPLAGTVGNLTMAFKTFNPIPAGGSISVILPVLDGRHFVFDGEGGNTQVGMISGFGSTYISALSVDGGSDTANLTLGGTGEISAGTWVRFNLTDIELPTVSGVTSAFKVRSLMGSGTLIDRNFSVPGISIGSGVANASEVNFTSYIAGDDVDVVFKVHLANPLPTTGRIVLQFPTVDGYGFTAPLGLGVTALQGFGSGGDANLTVVEAFTTPHKVVLTRVGASNAVPGDGHIVYFKLQNVRLPGVSGFTGVFRIRTETDTQRIIDVEPDARGRLIQPSSLSNVTATAQTLIAGAFSDLDVTLRLRNAISAGDMLDIQLPRVEDVPFNGSQASVSAFSPGTSGLSVILADSSNDLLRLQFSGTTLPRGQWVNFTITQLQLPTITGDLGAYSMSTHSVNSSLIDQGGYTPAIPTQRLQPGNLSDPSVTLSAVRAGGYAISDSAIRFQFTLDNPIPPLGTINVSLPSFEGGRTFTVDQPSATQVRAVQVGPGVGGNVSLVSAGSDKLVVRFNSTSGKWLPPGSIVIFDIFNVRNPAITGASDIFQFHTFSDLGVPIDQHWQVPGVSFIPNQIPDSSVTLSSPVAGNLSDLQLNFTLFNDLPINGRLTLVLPPSPPGNFNWTADNGISVSSIKQSSDGVYKLAQPFVSGGPLYLNLSDATTVESENVEVSLLLSGFRVPPSSLLTGPFLIYSYTDQLTAVDNGTADGVSISTNLLTDASVDIENKTVGVISRTLTVTFTLFNYLPVDAKIEVEFPPSTNGFFQVLGTASVVSGFPDGGLTVVSNPQGSVIVQRSGASEIAPNGTDVVFVLRDVQLPSVSGHVGTYNITTFHSTDIPIDSVSQVPGQILLPAAIEDLLVSVHPATAGEVAELAFNITIVNDLPVNCSLSIDFPLTQNLTWNPSATPVITLGGFGAGATPSIHFFDQDPNSNVLWFNVSGMSTGVSAGSYILFNVSNIVVPATSGPSGRFGINTYNQEGVLVDSGETNSVSIATNTFQRATVTFDSTVAGSTNALNVTLRLTNDWQSDGELILTFPFMDLVDGGGGITFEPNQGFQPANAPVNTTLSDIVGVSGNLSLSWALGSGVAVLARSNGTLIPGGTLISFLINEVRIPGRVGYTGDIDIATTLKNGLKVDRNAAVSGETLVKAVIQVASVVPVQSTAGARTSVDLSFVTPVTVPLGGRFVIAVNSDSEYGWKPLADYNGSTSLVTPQGGFPSGDSLTMSSFADRIIVVDRLVSSALIPFGTVVQMRVTNVKLPIVPGLSGTFNVTVRDSNDTVLAANYSVPEVDIGRGTLQQVSVAPLNPLVGVVTDLEVDMRIVNPIFVNNTIELVLGGVGNATFELNDTYSVIQNNEDFTTGNLTFVSFQNVGNHTVIRFSWVDGTSPLGLQSILNEDLDPFYRLRFALKGIRNPTNFGRTPPSVVRTILEPGNLTVDWNDAVQGIAVGGGDLSNVTLTFDDPRAGSITSMEVRAIADQKWTTQGFLRMQLQPLGGYNIERNASGTTKVSLGRGSFIDGTFTIVRWTQSELYVQRDGSIQLGSNAPLALRFSNVRVPRVTGTIPGGFLLEITSDNDFLIADAPNTPEITVFVQNMDEGTIVFDNYRAGGMATMTVSFVTKNPVDNGGFIRILLPKLRSGYSTYSLGVPLAQIVVTILSNLGSTTLVASAWEVDTLVLAVGGAQIEANATVTFAVDRMRNPGSEGDTNNFQVLTQAASLADIDLHDSITGVRILPGAVNSASFDIIPNADAASDRVVIVAGNLTNAWPSDGSAYIDFPGSNGEFFVDNSSTLAAFNGSTPLNAGTIDVAYVGFRAIITRQGDGDDIPDGSLVRFTFPNTTTPALTGSLSNFQITTLLASGVLIDSEPDCVLAVVACPIGSFDGSPGVALCSPCGEGTFASQSGLLQCLDCPSGRHQNLTGRSFCFDCTVGKYSGSGQDYCTDCPFGKFVDDTASVLCTDCQPGRYRNNSGATACELCDVGMFADDAGRSLCSECPAGRATNSSGSLICENCGVGLFSQVTGAFECEQCPKGRFNREEGQDDCVDCQPGRFAAVEGEFECSDCSLGQFQNVTGKSTCLACGLGTTTLVTGQTFCDKCPAGKFTRSVGDVFCVDCTLGTFGLPGGGCADCPSGKFADNTGLTDCNECFNGTFAASDGQSECELCEEGKFQGSNGQSSCSGCPKGRFASETGLSVCKECGIGTFQAAESQIECNPCPQGKFQNSTGKEDCLNCPVGFYGPLTGLPNCTACDSGEFTGGSGASAPSPCDPGRFNNASALSFCYKCPIGTSQQDSGSTSCVDCAIGKAQNAPGAVQCTDCSPGTFNNASGVVNCPPCRPGKFAPNNGRTVCDPCPTGTDQTNPSSTSCNQCNEGTFANNSQGASECGDCPIGRFINLKGKAACDPCPLGRAVSQLGQTVCDVCSSGTVANVSGLTACLNCPPGRASGAERQNCTSCPVGTFSDDGVACENCQSNQIAQNTGQSACDLCPPGSSANPSRDLCECDIGKAFKDGACVTCPECTVCETVGVDWDTIEVKAGCWQSDVNPDNFLKCLKEEHCAGGVNNDCGQNRVGKLCALCKEGFHSTEADPTCIECPAQGESVWVSIAWGVGILAALIILYLLVLRQQSAEKEEDELLREQQQQELGLRADNVAGSYQLEAFLGYGVATEVSMEVWTKEKRSSATMTFNLKIIVGFFQIASSLDSVVEVTYPTAYRTFINYFNFVKFNFIPWQSVECVAKFSFYTRFMIVSVTPVVLLVVLCSVLLIPLFFMDRNDLMDEEAGRKKRTKIRQRFSRIVLFTLFLLYPGVSLEVLSFFVCKEVEGEWYLVADFELRCFQDKWVDYFPAALVMTCIYPLGVPLSFLIVLTCYRKQLGHPNTKAALGFLYEAYAGTMWFFEVVEMFYKLFMTSLLVFFTESYQLPAGMSVLCFFSGVVLIYQPYVRANDDRMALVAQCVLYLLLLIGYTIQHTDPLEKNSAEDIALSVICIAITIALMIVFLYHGVFYLVHIIKQRQRLKILKAEKAAEKERAENSDEWEFETDLSEDYCDDHTPSEDHQSRMDEDTMDTMLGRGMPSALEMTDMHGGPAPIEGDAGAGRGGSTVDFFQNKFGSPRKRASARPTERSLGLALGDIGASPVKPRRLKSTEEAGDGSDEEQPAVASAFQMPAHLLSEIPVEQSVSRLPRYSVSDELGKTGEGEQSHGSDLSAREDQSSDFSYGDATDGEKGAKKPQNTSHPLDTVREKDMFPTSFAALLDAPDVAEAVSERAAGEAGVMKSPLGTRLSRAGPNRTPFSPNMDDLDDLVPEQYSPENSRVKAYLADEESDEEREGNMMFGTSFADLVARDESDEAKGISEDEGMKSPTLSIPLPASGGPLRLADIAPHVGETPGNDEGRYSPSLSVRTKNQLLAERDDLSEDNESGADMFPATFTGMVEDDVAPGAGLPNDGPMSSSRSSSGGPGSPPQDSSGIPEAEDDAFNEVADGLIMDGEDDFEFGGGGYSDGELDDGADAGFWNSPVIGDDPYDDGVLPPTMQYPEDSD